MLHLLDQLTVIPIHKIIVNLHRTKQKWKPSSLLYILPDLSQVRSKLRPLGFTKSLQCRMTLILGTLSLVSHLEAMLCPTGSILHHIKARSVVNPSPVVTEHQT